VTDSAGEWVEKEEELTMDRFVVVDGRRGAGGRPAGGAQAAWPRSASVWGTPAWERGAVVLGRLGRPCGTTKRLGR
jgi:hypothetical protein